MEQTRTCNVPWWNKHICIMFHDGTNICNEPWWPKHIYVIGIISKNNVSVEQIIYNQHCNDFSFNFYRPRNFTLNIPGLAWMVQLVFSDINLHMKIHTEIPHKFHAVQNPHSNVFKCLSYSQSSHHFQMEYIHKGTVVYAHIIENPEKVAGIWISGQLSVYCSTFPMYEMVKSRPDLEQSHRTIQFSQSDIKHVSHRLYILLNLRDKWKNSALCTWSMKWCWIIRHM